MVMKEHPFGCEMLAQLLAAGLPPRAILQEDSPAAATERGKFLRRIEGHTLAPSIAEQAQLAKIDVHDVPEHTDEHCIDWIRALAPNLIVFGGTRIIRGEILSYPRDGVLNAHPGLLPECRGSASPAWSVYYDIPIGSSCHYCSAGIDEGDLVGRREVDVYRGDTYEDLCFKTLQLAGTLMREAIEAYAERRLDTLRQQQGPSARPTLKNIPNGLLREVHLKLREESYAHYCD